MEGGITCAIGLLVGRCCCYHHCLGICWNIQDCLKDFQATTTNSQLRKVKLKCSTHQVSPMWIQLPILIGLLDINQHLVNEPDDLQVIGRTHELDAGEGVGRHDAGAAAWLGAPCDFFALRVCDGRVGFGRRPEAEV